MKIYCHIDENGNIISVQSCDILSIPEQAVIERINEVNARNDRDVYKIFDIPKELEETICFLLGERKYKTYKDIDNLENAVADFSAEVSNLYNEAYDLNCGFERIEKMFKEMQKNVEKLNIQ